MWMMVGFLPWRSFQVNQHILLLKSPHMGMSSLCLRCNIIRQYICKSKWEPLSCAGMYLVHSPFHVVSVALFINPETGYVSPQFHVVFDDEFSTAPFMREGTIPPNWIYIVQRISKICSLDIIGLKETWFTPYIEEDPRETPTHVLIVTPDNNLNIITLSYHKYNRVQSVRECQSLK